VRKIACWNAIEKERSVKQISGPIKLLAVMLGIVGFYGVFRVIDRWDGINEAHECLDLAIKDGQTDEIKSFILNKDNFPTGITINERFDDGGTWLMYAAKYGRPQSVKALLEVGADVNIRDKNGRTALKIAEQKGYSEIVQVLQATGAKE